jgi:hypothetical protein
MNDILPPTGERPAASLQESILCALAFYVEQGAAIAAQVSVEHFDAPYQILAERLLDYRRTQGAPPGRAHLDDIFAEQLTGKDAPQYRKLLFALVHLSDHLNARWVAEQTGAWIQEQRLKGATLAAADIFSGGGRDIAEQVRTLFHEAITVGAPQLDPGLRLTDTARAFRFLDRNEDGVPLAIEPFDKAGLAFVPQQMFMYIAPKGTGKTWFAVHCGKQALLYGKTVLHVTLEISDADVAARYYAALFGVAREAHPLPQRRFRRDALGNLDKARWVKRTPKFFWRDPAVRSLLGKELGRWGVRLGRLIIKEFPAGSLTLAQLEHHLDYLAFQQNFVPDCLIIDYPDLMRIDAKDLRIGLGRLYVGLRGLAARRNLMLITPTQGNRKSLEARRVRSSNVSEDITKVQTADVVMTYSASSDERKQGLGRLLLEHARGMEDKLYCMIAQNYAMGQFCVDAFEIKSVAMEGDLERKLGLDKGAMSKDLDEVEDDGDDDE